MQPHAGATESHGLAGLSSDVVGRNGGWLSGEGVGSKPGGRHPEFAVDDIDGETQLRGNLFRGFPLPGQNLNLRRKRVQGNLVLDRLRLIRTAIAIAVGIAALAALVSLTGCLVALICPVPRWIGGYRVGSTVARWGQVRDRNRRVGAINWCDRHA